MDNRVTSQRGLSERWLNGPNRNQARFAEVFQMRPMSSCGPETPYIDAVSLKLSSFSYERRTSPIATFCVARILRYDRREEA